jgi:tetratricopeptide (TPR) repeat protein
MRRIFFFVLLIAGTHLSVAGAQPSNLNDMLDSQRGGQLGPRSITAEDASSWAQQAGYLEHRGNYYLGAKDYDLAIARFDEAIRLGPTAARYYGRGTALLLKGELTRALADFDAAIALQPEFAEALVNRAGALIRLGRFDAAMPDVDTAIRLRPDIAEAFAQRGSLYERRGEYESARADYEAAVKKNTRYAAGWRGLGRTSVKLDRIDDALSAFDQAIRFDRGNAASYTGRAQAFVKAKQPERAAAELTRAVAIAPDSFSIQCNRVVLMMRAGQGEILLRQLDSEVRRRPSSAALRYGRGLTHAFVGHSRAAAEDLSIALAGTSVPEDAQAIRFVLSLVLLDSGDAMRARSTLDEYLRFKPDSLDGKLARAFAVRDSGDHERAIEDFNAGIAQAPNIGGFYHGRASTYMRQNRFDLALRDYDQALQITPACARTLYERAQLKRSMQDEPGARADLARAVELDPEIESRKPLHVGFDGPTTFCQNPVATPFGQIE